MISPFVDGFVLGFVLGMVTCPLAIWLITYMADHDDISH